jgi:hypothetical protein
VADGSGRRQLKFGPLDAGVRRRSSDSPQTLERSMRGLPAAGPVPRRRLRVTLRMASLRRNLSLADGTAYTEQQVRKWLADAGFVLDGNHWLVYEGNLGQLDPAEVIEVSAADDDVHG